MNEFDLLERNPKILGGKPIVKGTRISVQLILEWIASGGTVVTINDSYPHVSKEAIRQAILFASRSLDNTAYIDLNLAA